MLGFYPLGAVPLGGAKMFLLAQPAGFTQSVTNWLLYSTAIGGTGWNLTAMTAAQNNAPAPDGTNAAALIADTATTAQHLVSSNAQTAIASGSVWTQSVYAKPNGSHLAVMTAWGEPGQANFDMTAFTATPGGSCTNATITRAGNGWFRLTATYTKSNTNAAFYIGATNSIVSYLGNTNNSIWVWGAQVEPGPKASPHNPTVASVVTRNGAIFGLPPLINQRRPVVGIPTHVAFGTDRVSFRVHPVGIASTLHFGLITPKSVQTLYHLLQYLAPTYQVDEKPRVIALRFGDGYQQSVPDGITALDRTLTIGWDQLDPADSARLINFFRENAGRVVSLVAPRETVPRKWVIGPWHLTHPMANFDALTATLEERLYDGPLV